MLDAVPAAVSHAELARALNTNTDTSIPADRPARLKPVPAADSTHAFRPYGHNVKRIPSLPRGPAMAAVMNIAA